MKSHRRIMRLGAVVLTLGLAACGAHGQGLTPAPAIPQTQQVRPQDIIPGGIGNMSILNVLLGDAPPKLGGKRLSHLNLALREVDAVSNGNVTVLATFQQPRIVDVLTHQRNDGEDVARTDVPRTGYDQLRLVVDTQDSGAQVQGSGSLPLDFAVNTATMSSAGAGVSTATVTDGPGTVDIIVTQPFTVPSAGEANLRLDFNAFESLALASDGTVFTRPAMALAPVDLAGEVKGRVQTQAGYPVEDATIVLLNADGSVANTGSTNAKGAFHIDTLTAGAYKLMIYNTYTNAAGAQFHASSASTVNSASIVTGPTVNVHASRVTATGIITD